MNRTILVLTVSPWDEPKRLRRQIAEALGGFNNVIYVTLPYGLRKPARSSNKVEAGVRVIEFAGPAVPLRLLVRSELLWGLYCRLIRRRLKNVLAGLPKVTSVVTFTYEYARALDDFHDVPVFFVANDNHAALTTCAKDRRRAERNEKALLEIASGVIAVSQNILDRYAGHSRNLHLFYPGHDCTPQDSASVNWANREDTKTACFFGYIDWRIDFEVISALLAEGWAVTLIGPVIETAGRIQTLKSIYPRKFSVKPPVDADVVVSALKEYGVLLMPYRFRTAEQREAIELPNKTFVYFAALRPVVATWMPNLKYVGDGLIYMARDTHEFTHLCTQALQLDSRQMAYRREQLARDNHWRMRAEILQQIIDPQ